MKKLGLSLIFITSIVTSSYAENQLLDRVVAVVNDEAITQSELDMLLRPLYEEFRKEYHGEKLMGALMEARQKLLNQLIEDRLVFQEAKRKAIEGDEAEVENTLEEFRKRFKTETEMEEALKKEGISMTKLRERFQRQSSVRRLQDIEIRAKIVVSPTEIENYFKDHPDEFSSQEKIKVRSFTLKKSEEAKDKGLTDEAAKGKIDIFRKRILLGEDFAALAKEHSEDAQAKSGGVGEWIKRGEMIPAIEQIIFALEPGAVSNIVETEMGYHFFKMEEREPGKTRTFEEVRDEIFEKIFRQKASKRFHEWMDELKRAAYISIR